jgi:hypothetical protein
MLIYSFLGQQHRIQFNLLVESNINTTSDLNRVTRWLTTSLTRQQNPPLYIPESYSPNPRGRSCMLLDSKHMHPTFNIYYMSCHTVRAEIERWRRETVDVPVTRTVHRAGANKSRGMRMPAHFRKILYNTASLGQHLCEATAQPSLITSFFLPTARQRTQLCARSCRMTPLMCMVSAPTIRPSCCPVCRSHHGPLHAAFAG